MHWYCKADLDAYLGHTVVDVALHHACDLVALRSSGGVPVAGIALAGVSSRDSSPTRATRPASPGPRSSRLHRGAGHHHDCSSTYDHDQ